MLDNYYHTTKRSTTYIKQPDTIKVHEHKAPTDESIRLLNEMQEKALQNILWRLKVDTNEVKGTVIFCEFSFPEYHHRLFFRYNFNGTEKVAEIELDHHELLGLIKFTSASPHYEQTVINILTKIVEVLAKDIAKQEV